MELEKLIENLDFAKGVWLPILFGIIVFLFALFMPKRISWRDIYVTFGLITGLAWMLDVFIGAIIDSFDLGEPQAIGIGDIISVGIIPSSLAVIFLNYYKSEKKWFHVILFSVISVAFEWGSVQVGFMKLHGWNTWWSIPVYLFMFGFYLPWHLKFIRGAYNDDGNSDRKFSLKLNGKEKAR
ncbi:hypothetical protein [Ammoniphilus sp. YIM 78166]|uniref:hypothetical protein n=1 Tax=Ammoniphilus sp. YIM 78166 TaxID=1644106 RepID=UPI00106FEA2B|nr:hypothetical protein [Ammoniphilus sp. YIM 78166]